MSKTKSKFRVWMCPLDTFCRVRVDGFENGRWLLYQLSRAFVFKTCEPVHEDHAARCSIFRVSYGSRMSQTILSKVLAGIPEVTLMLDPA